MQLLTTLSSIPVLHLVLLFSKSTFAQDVEAGFDVSSAAQVMVNGAAQSWEWGTAAEALLELYNNELSVFGSNPFPNGKIPQANTGTLALAYARPHISVSSETFVANAAVGDPASLGVSALLLGQSENVYIAASERQANYILNRVPKLSNGAISHRPDVAEAWADFSFMAPPFLAYLAVQQNNPDLMSSTVNQLGLQRAILKGGSSNWQHIIGPQSQDTGLWSSGNGWACYGMIRVLNTLQKWSGSSGMTSQAGQLKGWIKEIIDGAMASGLDNGLLRNYLNDNSWFGEISGTSLLTACVYRMAVNDPGTYGQQYITWADARRKAVGATQNANGVFSPAVNPLDWKSRTPFTTGSPEGQAFTVFMYSAFRDCVSAGICAPALAPVSTISRPGIGPIDIMTVLDRALTFTSMTTPPRPTCGAPQSCDLNGCAGSFPGLTKNPICTGGSLAGCQCIPTQTTCGAHQSCDNNGCAGAFNGLTKFAQCTGNFVGCECTATANTCGPHQSCDNNGCAGAFTGLTKYPQCTGNFIGCECTATPNTCGAHQSCDNNGCAGAFSGLTKYPQCTGNFVGCECTATPNTCGAHQSCDNNGCAGAFSGLKKYAQCTGNFVGCECTATPNTCGQRQSCDQNGCAGAYNGLKKYAQCTGNFVGCECSATPNTCGARQSCDNNGCAGAFSGLAKYPKCTGNFVGCDCAVTPNTCGAQLSCDLNNCGGSFDLSNGRAFCRNNFEGCQCAPTSNTCGAAQSCDNNNCAGAFSGLVKVPTCTNFFKPCVCVATPNTCGAAQSCDRNGCAGAFNSAGVARCTGNFAGCGCTATSATCGNPLSCDLNGCNGRFVSTTSSAQCTGNFPGCPCLATSNTCGSRVCDRDGCNGANLGNGFRCTGAFYNCPCTQPSIPPPPPPPPPPPFPACTDVDISSLSCDRDCCGWIPCPDWCNAVCGGVDPRCI